MGKKGEWCVYFEEAPNRWWYFLSMWRSRVCDGVGLLVQVACFPQCHVVNLWIWTRTVGFSSPGQFFFFLCHTLSLLLLLFLYPFLLSIFNKVLTVMCLIAWKLLRCTRKQSLTKSLHLRACAHSTWCPSQTCSLSPLCPKSPRLKTTEPFLKPACLSSCNFKQVFKSCHFYPMVSVHTSSLFFRH